MLVEAKLQRLPLHVFGALRWVAGPPWTRVSEASNLLPSVSSPLPGWPPILPCSRTGWGHHLYHFLSTQFRQARASFLSRRDESSLRTADFSLAASASISVAATCTASRI